MATEIDLLRAELARIERELEAVRSKIEKLEKEGVEEPRPFARLRGVWKGKVHFTQEEIDAAKIRVKDFPK